MDKKNVMDYIEQNSQLAVDWLSKMISIPSVNNGYDWSVDNENDVQHWIAQNISNIGLEDVQLWAEDPDGVRPNVAGRLKGTGGGKSLMLAGHCDVVPVMQPENWKYPPFGGVVADGMVHGRGATDMKGGLAAEMLAIKALKECGYPLKGDVIFASCAGEETGEGGTIGAAKIVQKGYKADFCIVAEGTDLNLLTASTGIFMFDLIIRGKSVHGSCRNQVIFPQPYGVMAGSEVGVDALDKAIPFIRMFRRLEDQWNMTWRHSVVGSGGVDFMDGQGVGVFCISPVFIEGGVYRASINPIVKITYYVWYPPNKTIDEVIAEIKRNIDAQTQLDYWLMENPPEFIAPTRKPMPAFETPLDNDGVKMLRDVYRNVMGEDASVSGLKAVCDCPYFNREGVPSVILGPGCSFCNHGDNEFIYIENIIKAAKVYAAAAIDWCNRTN